MCPQAWGFTQLIGKLTEYFEMVHFYNTDVLKDFCYAGSIGSQKNTVVNIKTNRGHFGLLSTHVIQHHSSI